MFAGGLHHYFLRKGFPFIFSYTNRSFITSAKSGDSASGVRITANNQEHLKLLAKRKYILCLPTCFFFAFSAKRRFSPHAAVAPVSQLVLQAAFGEVRFPHGVSKRGEHNSRTICSGCLRRGNPPDGHGWCWTTKRHFYTSSCRESLIGWLHLKSFEDSRYNPT